MNRLTERVSVVSFTVFSPLGHGSTLLFGNRVVLNPGLGGVRDVAYAIISHKHTKSNRVCVFKLWMLNFQIILFSRLFVYSYILPNDLLLYGIPSRK